MIQSAILDFSLFSPTQYLVSVVIAELRWECIGCFKTGAKLRYFSTLG